jgi:hypothetical protein
MNVYSVFISLDESVESDWLTFMNDKHIKEVLDTECFTGYEFFREIDSPEIGKVRFRIDYYLTDSSKMEKYISKFSEALRNDVVARFDGKFTAERRNYEIIKTFR